MIPATRETLEQLADEDGDWAEGDEVFNAAIHWLAQKEVVARQAKRIEDLEAQLSTKNYLVAYWYERCKNGGPDSPAPERLDG